MKQNIKILRWNNIERLISKCLKKLPDTKFDFIVTIARGGLIPSVIISHKLGIRDILIIDIQRTLNDDINAFKISPLINVGHNFSKIKGKKILLVDDIIGSGETLKTAIFFLEKYDPQKIETVCLVFNKNNYKEGNPLPEYIGMTVNLWVVFPWE